MVSVADEQKNNSLNTEEIINAISSENFVNLPSKTQDKILGLINANTNNAGGFMGKFFGNNKDNASIHIVFVICAILLLLCVIDILCAIYQGRSAYTELTKNIIPIISLAIGYLLGKGKE